MDAVFRPAVSIAAQKTRSRGVDRPIPCRAAGRTTNRMALVAEPKTEAFGARTLQVKRVSIEIPDHSCGR